MVSLQKTKETKVYILNVVVVAVFVVVVVVVIVVCKMSNNY